LRISGTKCLSKRWAAAHGLDDINARCSSFKDCSRSAAPVYRPAGLGLVRGSILESTFPTLCTVSAGMEKGKGPSSQRFECGDENIFGHQFRRLKVREEQARSHRIQYADKLPG